MSQVLELKFNTSSGKTMTISVNDPKPNLTPTEITSVADTIINEDIFHQEGNSLVSVNQARIVERNISEIDFA